MNIKNLSVWRYVSNILCQYTFYEKHTIDDKHYYYSENSQCFIEYCVGEADFKIMIGDDTVTLKLPSDDLVGHVITNAMNKYFADIKKQVTWEN